MFKTIDRYEETGLGLPYAITLIDGAEVEIDDETGAEVGISVPDQEQLAAAVALARVLVPVQLAPEEIKFVRFVLGMTATAFADELCVDKATYSRYENGKQTCSEWVDKQVRRIAVIKLSPLVPCLTLDPTSVVGLRITPLPGGSWDGVPADMWPRIEMHRVPTCAQDMSDLHAEAWDPLPLAA